MESLLSFLKVFSITEEKKEKIKNEIECKFEAGLAEDPNIYMYSPVKMLPTYISVFKNNEYKGCFVSIDFGGTNLRFVKIFLDDGHLITEFISETIPEDIKSSSGDKLFDYIANSLKNGLKVFGMEDKVISHVGFTFSFPCSQNALNHGVLMHWTKGFNIADVEGKDVVNLLLESCRKIGIKVDDFCLLNDTTGTLLCGSYEERCTYIAIINGTGTNACYLEQAEKVKRMKPTRDIGDSVIINTEWGSLGESGILDIVLTEYDKILDANSINPHRQIFEKCISGLYLPELARIVITKEAERFGIFKKLPEGLEKPYCLDGKYLSCIYDRSDFVKAFKEQFNYHLSWKEFRIIKAICKALVDRAAILTALALSKLIERITADKIVIAVDGSMCRKHPTYLLMVAQELKNHTRKKFEFKHVDDGSGKGSALAASIASSRKINGYKI